MFVPVEGMIGVNKIKTNNILPSNNNKYGEDNNFVSGGFGRITRTLTIIGSEDVRAQPLYHPREGKAQAMIVFQFLRNLPCPTYFELLHLLKE